MEITKVTQYHNPSIPSIILTSFIQFDCDLRSIFTHVYPHSLHSMFTKVMLIWLVRVVAD